VKKRNFPFVDSIDFDMRLAAMADNWLSLFSIWRSRRRRDRVTVFYYVHKQYCPWHTYRKDV